MLALGRHHPALGRDNLLLLEDVLARVPIEDSPAIDPGPQIGRDRDIGRGGHDPLRQKAVFSGDFRQDPAEALLGRHPGRVRHHEATGQRNPLRLMATGATGVKGHGGQEVPQGFDGQVEPRKGLPFLARRNPVLGLKTGHLGLVHQSGMVVLVACEGQSEALDRVGYEASRPVIVDGFEGL